MAVKWVGDKMYTSCTICGEDTTNGEDCYCKRYNQWMEAQAWGNCEAQPLRKKCGWRK